MYASYKDQIEFLVVYIREAHPNLLREGNKTGIVGRPRNFDERVILATECVTRYKLSIPMVIDGMDGNVNNDYQAAPVRVTVTDIDGKVAFYAGRGPFDFRLGTVERTLKKLVANGGHMPPPPVVKWSQEVNGLRCGLAFDPEKLVVGEQITAQLRFENTTDRPINFYHEPTEAIMNIAISNDSGQTLKIEAAPAGRWSRARNKRASQPRTGRGGGPIQRIPPEGTFETEIEGKIVAAFDQAALVASRFSAVYSVEVNEETLAQFNPAPRQTVWTGKITSGTCTLNITSPPPTGCVDCHGEPDYHHKDNQNCQSCHVGEMGSDDFDVKKTSCAQCHPRDGVYGRRQILGPGGEFEMASRHIAGTIKDEDCLLCHDNSRHRTGVISLVDPDSGGKKPWTGTRTAFCLRCHDGEPPVNISFPAKSRGSGYDKSKFVGTTDALGGQGCTQCHNPHGSAYPSLLKDVHHR